MTDPADLSYPTAADIERVVQPRDAQSSSEDDTPALSCPECERVFTTPQGLGAHRMRTHGVAGTSDKSRSKRARGRPHGQNKKSQCPECGKLFAHVPRHLLAVHGIGEKNSGLTVGDVFDTVVEMLYPDGSVPVKALPALITWREQTQHLLDTVV